MSILSPSLSPSFLSSLEPLPLPLPLPLGSPLLSSSGCADSSSSWTDSKLAFFAASASSRAFFSCLALSSSMLILSARASSRVGRRVDAAELVESATAANAAGQALRRLCALAHEDGRGNELVAEQRPARRDDDQVAAVAALHLLVELLELRPGIVVDVAQDYKVYRNVALLELGGKRDEGLLELQDGRADEGNYAGALGLVLSVLEGELLRTGQSQKEAALRRKAEYGANRGRKRTLATWMLVARCASPRICFFVPVQALEDLALVCGQGHQNLGPLAGHAHQANGRLRVALDDALEYDIDGVSLGVEPCGRVVSVAAALAVIHSDHHGFERHPCGWLAALLSGAYRSWRGRAWGWGTSKKSEEGEKELLGEDEER